VQQKFRADSDSLKPGMQKIHNLKKANAHEQDIAAHTSPLIGETDAYNTTHGKFSSATASAAGTDQRQGLQAAGLQKIPGKRGLPGPSGDPNGSMHEAGTANGKHHASRAGNDPTVRPEIPR
jgi:hypothetical protein